MLWSAQGLICGKAAKVLCCMERSGFVCCKASTVPAVGDPGFHSVGDLGFHSVGDLRFHAVDDSVIHAAEFTDGSIIN